MLAKGSFCLFSVTDAERGERTRRATRGTRGGWVDGKSEGVEGYENAYTCQIGLSGVLREKSEGSEGALTFRAISAVMLRELN